MKGKGWITSLSETAVLAFRSSEKGVPNDGYDSEKHKNQPAIVPYEKMRIQAGGGIQRPGNSDTNF